MKVLVSKIEDCLEDELNGMNGIGVIQHLLERYPDTIQKNILTKKNCMDQMRSIVGYMLLEEGLKERFLVSSEDLQYQYKFNKKPYLKAFKDFHFNISHMDRMIVCGIADQEIGVDITRNLSYKMSMFQKLSNVKPCLINNVAICKLFEQLEQTDYFGQKEFTKLWCGLESVSKLVGCGIFQLHLQPVLPTTDTIYLELEDGYMVAISVFSQESNPLTINPMDMEIQYVPMKRA